MILAIAAPSVLLPASIIAESAGLNLIAHHAIRAARYLLVAELLVFMVLAAVGFAYEQRAEKRDREAYPPPGQLVDVGGSRLHLHCVGKGPTVVLEYGHQGNYTDWFRVQPQLAEFTRVCIYDRGGYAWSDPSPKPRVPTIMADELHALLHAAGEAPPYVLVGYSLGGLNALMFAHQFPDEVTGVVLVDSSISEMMAKFRWHDRLHLRLMQLITPFGLPRWRGWCSGSAPEEIRGLKQAITCRSSFYRTYYREWANFPQSAAEIRAIKSIGSIPLIVIARDPTIAATSEREVKWNDLQRARTVLSRNSEFVVASGSGHDVPMDRPDVIIAAVKRMVQMHLSAAASQNPE